MEPHAAGNSGRESPENSLKVRGSIRPSAEFISRVGRLFDWQELLREFVQIESPSNNKALVDAFAARVAIEFEKLGGTVELVPQLDVGSVLRVSFAPTPRKRPVLLLGH